jgi:glycosyltransferase involved in cell wall biosynthesis
LLLTIYYIFRGEILVKILAISHSLWFGGALISTLEFFNEIKNNLKGYDIELKVMICKGFNDAVISKLSSMHIEYYEAPCYIIMGYPVLEVHKFRKLVEWADIVWITDVEYLVVPQMIKRIKNVPIVAHLHSYALVCPWWGALYGFKELCLERCSVRRITKCKQGINLELARIGLLGDARARLYWLLDFVKGPLDFFRWSRLMNGVAESIDGFIAVSKALWDIHVHHLPSLGDKPFSIVYNPVTEPLKHVKPDPRKPYGDYVLYASGSNPVKGPHLLLEAWREVSREFRDLKLYMVGCKNTWVERKAHQMNLRNIVFMERLPPDRRYYYLMYKAKAVVMPSLVPEAFGRIPVEANRLGVPAIVSSAGALPEIIIDGITGYIFKSGDVGDLVKKVVKVLEKDFNREEIIKHSYEKVNPQREVEKLIEFFESVMNYKG